MTSPFRDPASTVHGWAVNSFPARSWFWSFRISMKQKMASAVGNRTLMLPISAVTRCVNAATIHKAAKKYRLGEDALKNQTTMAKH
jgi:hypothetical protein